MFNDIGKKIKGLAVALFAIEAIFSFIGGLVLMADGDDEKVAVGFLIMVGGVLFSWISSWFLYGFGEIIDKLQDVERNTRQTAENARTKGTNTPSASANTSPTDNAVQHTLTCPHCHIPNRTNRTICWYCGKELPQVNNAAANPVLKESPSVQVDNSTECKCGAHFTGNFCPNCGREKGSVI